MITMEQIQSVVNQIVELFQPERVILFGSHAYGEPTSESDVDLLVIMPFTGSVIEQMCRIRRLIQKPFPIDVIVKTPEEVAWRYEGYDPLVRYAVDHGKVLHG